MGNCRLLITNDERPRKRVLESLTHLEETGDGSKGEDGCQTETPRDVGSSEPASRRPGSVGRTLLSDAFEVDLPGASLSVAQGLRLSE